MNLNIRNEEINAKILVAVKKAAFAVAKVHVHNYCLYYIQICFYCRSYVIPLLVQNFLLTIKIAISKSNSLAQYAETKETFFDFS